MQVLEAPRQGRKVLPEVARSLLPWLAARLGTVLGSIGLACQILSSFLADSLQTIYKLDTENILSRSFKTDNELYTADVKVGMI